MFALVGACALSFVAGALLPRKYRRKVTAALAFAAIPIYARYQSRNTIVWIGSLALSQLLGRQLQMTGLTGGISCGKSAVVKIVHDQFPHIGVIDCDLLSRVVVEPGKPCLKAIVKIFGEDILLPDGTLDRPKLGQIVFSDSKLRRQLTKLTGRYIMWEIIKSLLALRLKGYSEVLLDAPLLYETKVLSWICSPIIVVHIADEGTWLDRLKTRDNISEVEARKKIASQMPITEKVKLSDCAIDNSGSLEQLQQRVISVFGNLSRRSFAHSPKM